MATKAPSDAHARRRALEPQTSFIVQAPAGSGKTELLVQRHLALLARVSRPEEVLAITFTRKAAAEMRARVLRALAQADEGEEPADEPARSRWRLARGALAHDEVQGWDLRAHPARLRIQTVDSLSLELTRQLPLVAGFGAQPAVCENPRPLYERAVQETLAESFADEDWWQRVEPLLNRLDNDLPRLQGLLVQMLARRDQWQRPLFSHPDALHRQALEAAMESLVCEVLAGLAALVPADLAEEVMSVASEAASHLDDDASVSELAGLAEQRQLPGSGPDDVDAWCGLAGLFLTKTGQWRKKADRRLGILPPKEGKTPEEKARREGLKDRYQAVLQALTAVAGLKAALHQVRELPARHYNDAQWQALGGLVDLLQLASAQLLLVFRGRGEVDFVEVAQRAVSALGEVDAPTDLALAMDYQIQHLLVDEFQDTSVAQWLLLERLTAGWQRDDGRTLFLVGDPMQSIYRFREAEVGLFLRARRQGLGQVELADLRLSANFRSEPALVDWVNRAFVHILPAEEDMVAGAVPYTPAEAAVADGAGGVGLHGYISGAAESESAGEEADRWEAARVCTLVEDTLSADPKARIAILGRTRRDLYPVLHALREADIGFRAVEMEALDGQPVVQDLLALTRALLHAGDRAAWLAVLRAPWCGLSLADLLVVAGDGRQLLWERLGLPEMISALSPAGQQRLARVVPVLIQARQGRRRQGLRNWVESTWCQLGGPACADSAGALEAADAYLAVLASLDVAGDLPDPAVLEAHLERLHAPAAPGADDRVQIMTVHKAKGLEFDTVIVPGLGRRRRALEERLLWWLYRPTPRGEPDLLLAPIGATGEDNDPTCTYLKRLEKIRGDWEAGRLLYVATTRARTHLHLIGSVRQSAGDNDAPSPDSNSLLALLWPAVGGHFLQPAAGDQAAKTPDSPASIPGRISGPKGKLRLGLRRLSADWVLPAPPAGIFPPSPVNESEPPAGPVEYSWAGQTARLIGIVAHRLLHTLAQEGSEHWDVQRVGGLARPVALMLKERGISGDELDAAARRVVSVLRGVLGDPRGRWVLSGDHTQAQCEYPLSGYLDGRLIHVRLDRSFVDVDGVCWVVDYKTGGHEGGDREAFLDQELARYLPQLGRYAALMKHLHDGPVCTALYYPVLQGWREWRA